MPPRLPARYRLHVRLGRDGDIEEWLATDTELDRPVLVRFLPPDAGPERAAAFLAPVRAAAATSHPHLQQVYAAGAEAAATYSISEWDGAVSVADRLRAGEVFPATEFLPNAAGLADGLAAFHAIGGVHGAIDATTIHFSAAHPAKLGGFGRLHPPATAEDDTRALAVALRQAITGSLDANVLPSHVVEGVPPSLDDALVAAEEGRLDAAGLAGALRGIPAARRSSARRPGTLRWLLAFLSLAALLVGLAAAGLGIGDDAGAPFRLPAALGTTPPPARAAPPPAPSPVDDGTPLPAEIAVYDPLGDGIEEDSLAPLAVDGDPATAWHTETYSRPLTEIKAGVGVVLTVAGTPHTMEIVGTPGSRFRIGWSPEVPEDPAAWEDVASGLLIAAPSRLTLPDRDGGVWLLWFVDLPRQDDGSYRAALSEVRFLP